jgi:hypothetical protein
VGIFGISTTGALNVMAKPYVTRMWVKHDSSLPADDPEIRIETMTFYGTFKQFSTRVSQLEKTEKFYHPMLNLVDKPTGTNLFVQAGSFSVKEAQARKWFGHLLNFDEDYAQ